MTAPHHTSTIAMPRVRKRGLFSPVWIVPALATIFAVYLGMHALDEKGETITITFNTADGLIAGQTQIKYKAVSLGLVTEISLDHEHKHVLVKARMNKTAQDMLNKHTRFWVVRPRFAYGSLSGFETLVSGAYIQCDPGAGDGKTQNDFTGLEEPPGVRVDEPGTMYTLQAQKLGTINVGSPIYFRDINVGEVLHYDIGDGYGPIIANIFIRAPYDKFVRQQSHFWNVSGVSVNFNPGGLQLQMQSVQSVLTGGIAFSTGKQWQQGEQAAQDSVFRLYENKQEAEVDDTRKRISYVAYFQNSVKGMEAGSPVSIYGIQVGEVNGVNLVFDGSKPDVKARVRFEIQPESAFQLADNEPYDALAITRRMVTKGLRAKIEGGGLLPGQKGLSLEFVPKARKEDVATEGNLIVMPSSAGGGIDAIADAVSDIAAKLNRIPFAEIGDNLNTLLLTANDTLGGEDMQHTLHELSATMEEAHTLVAKANQGMTPALQRLPEISRQLQSALTRVNNSMAGFDQKSDLQRSAKRTLDQVNDAARSIRLLADFLSHHPEALVHGRDIQENGQ